MRAVRVYCNTGCRVDVSPTDVSPTDVSPTDVSPTENSCMLRPLNKASLCAPDQCVPTLVRVKHGTSSIVCYSGLGRPPISGASGGPASLTPLTRFIGLSPLRQMHARPSHRTPPLCSAKAHDSGKSGVALLNQI